MSLNNETTNDFQEVDSNFPYYPPCMRCQPIIDFVNLRFQSSNIKNPIELFKTEEADNIFGVFDIKIRGEIPINSKHIHLFFTIDGSGSMGDRCADGRTKMEHIHHTLENMIRILHSKKNIEISIHIQSFDTKIKTIISGLKNIRDCELSYLTANVRSIYPGDSTNIEIALQKAKEEIENYHIENPNHEIVHIFLTDGEITLGSTDYEILKDLISSKCTNIFIGYGMDHDCDLLQHLSSNKGDEYRFIDELEKSGLVYGEVIHGILYKAIEDVTLKVSFGEIYNFQTNAWVNELEIGNLLSEQLKTFHVRSKSINDFTISIFGKTIIQTYQFQKLNIYERFMDVSTFITLSEINVDIYMFRQRTQELLYEARKSNNKKLGVFDSMRPFEELINSPFDVPKNENKIEIKKKLNDFHKVMMNYIKEKNLESDPMMKMLCDDIYIAYKTMGTSFGNMFTCARATSNGRQQAYVCSGTTAQTLLVKPRMNKIQRTTSDQTFNFEDGNDFYNINTLPFDNREDLNEIDSYIPSQDILSPFSSEGVVTLMRDISGNPTIGNTNSYDGGMNEMEAEDMNTLNIFK
jgi:hypothetical protein